MLLASGGKRLGMLPNVLQYVISWIGRPPTNVDSAEAEKLYSIELMSIGVSGWDPEEDNSFRGEFEGLRSLGIAEIISSIYLLKFPVINMTVVLEGVTMTAVVPICEGGDLRMAACRGHNLMRFKVGSFRGKEREWFESSSEEQQGFSPIFRPRDIEQ